MTHHFKPFDNESDTTAIGGLTIENRTDRVSIYGSIDLTADKAGQAKALMLQALLAGVLERLGSLDRDGRLPDEIQVEAPTVAKNPFE